jgi:hypothetical protein
MANKSRARQHIKKEGSQLRAMDRPDIALQKEMN